MFQKLQSIALWFHIPLWIAAGIIIVVSGAYYAGREAAQGKKSLYLVESMLDNMTMKQLTNIKVSDI